MCETLAVEGFGWEFLLRFEPSDVMELEASFVTWLQGKNELFAFVLKVQAPLSDFHLFPNVLHYRHLKIQTPTTNHQHNLRNYNGSDQEPRFRCLWPPLHPAARCWQRSEG